MALTVSDHHPHLRMPDSDPARHSRMDDDTMHRLAHELAEAIGGAVSDNPRVEACREKARAAGYELRVSLEAEIGFGSRAGAAEPRDGKAPRTTTAIDDPPAQLAITANDRRFLRALRIAAEEPAQPAGPAE